MDKLPRELLQPMMRHVIASEGPQGMLPLLLVCKSWTTLAENVLHENINICTSRALYSLRNKFILNFGKHVQNQGHPIRTLKISIPIDEVTNDEEILHDSIMSILVNTHSLRAFEISHIHSSYADLTCLHRNSATTLTRLEIVISGRAVGVFQIISELSHLYELNLSFEDSVDRDAWLHPIEHCLRMPCIRHLWWTWPHADNPAMMRFLADCHFGNLLSAQLSVPETAPGTASILVPFIKANTFSELYLEIDPQSQVVLAPHIMGLRHLRIYEYQPHLELLEHKCMPKRLELDFSEDIEGCLHFLNIILAKRFTFKQSRSVKILWDHTFKWLGGEADEVMAIAVGRLIPVASALLKRDIKLLDDDDKDITCITRPAHV